MMKTSIIFISLLLLSLGIKASTPDSLFIKEVDSFINVTKKNSVAGGKYNLYVINFVRSPDSVLCFSVTYIQNSFSLKHINYSHYFKLHLKEEVLVNIDGKVPPLLSSLYFEKIAKNEHPIFLNKLFPQGEGGISGFQRGEICYIAPNGIQKIFYENSDDMPEDFSIYNESIWKKVKVERVALPR